jgi:hypothetical protein
MFAVNHPEVSCIEGGNNGNFSLAAMIHDRTHRRQFSFGSSSITYAQDKTACHHCSTRVSANALRKTEKTNGAYQVQLPPTTKLIGPVVNDPSLDTHPSIRSPKRQEE